MVSKERKLLYSLGVNDADYRVRITQNYYKNDGSRTSRDVWVCPYFSSWKRMLSRCYGKSRECYTNVNVCEEWLAFSNFKAWMEKQDWKGNELDKDLLGDGNLYSPNNCIFLPSNVNSFLIDQKKSGFKGTSYYKRLRKWQANVRNPFTRKLENLGYYVDREEAHKVYFARKRELAKELAKSIENERPDIYNALALKFNF